MDRLELMESGDLFHNYCLWPYDPVASPVGKWRSANLLYHSFDVAGENDAVFDLTDTIRKAMGMSNSVWGVKWIDGALRWEYYFYDYRRRRRERSISLLKQAVSPMVPCAIEPNENLPYFMFSLDIDHELVTGQRGIEEIHLYTGIPGGTVSAGMSHLLTRDRTRFENIYFFFDPAKDMDEIMKKVSHSAFFDSSRIAVSDVLLPELIKCQTVCIANKQFNDCAYFAGVTVDQLLLFMKSLRYPEELVSHIVENRSSLDHLLFDVGIDYRMRDNELLVVKSGYFGYL